MKFRMSLLLIIIGITLLFVSGCENLSTNQTNSTQIENDLKQHEDVVHCFYSDFVSSNEFQFDGYEVIKRKTDAEEGTDSITCAIYAHSDYFSVQMKATLEYSYYDVGGWILDEFNVLEKCVTPLCAPDLDMATEAIISIFNAYNTGNDDWLITGWLATFRKTNGSSEFSRHLQNFEFEDFELTEDKLSAKLDVSFWSSLTRIEGYFPFEFDNNTGWHWTINQNTSKKVLPIFKITSYSADYTEALGKFIGFDVGSMSYTQINVLNIEDDSVTVEITYEMGYRNERTYTKEVDFNAYAGKFAVGGGFVYDYFYYNPFTENWENVNPGIKRIDEYTRAG